MYQPLDTLPDTVLDAIVSEALTHVPSSHFLASLGRRVHDSALRVLFGALQISDDNRVLGRNGSSHSQVILPILANPERYGRAVRTLEFQQPVPEELAKPLDSSCITKILGGCVNIEEVVWNSFLPPPNNLCETLSLHTPRLSHFCCSEGAHSRLSETHSGRHREPKWDAPSLPLLSSLPLTSLHLSRLSQSGTRALSALLSNIGEYSLLDDVSFDIVWLDDAICDKIAYAGRRIRTLRLGTRGTKLSDKGFVSIIEGCESLEEFALDDVQGRLTRSLWIKPTHYPVGLRNIRVAISESSPHHSWTTDHLDSIHAIPFPTLQSFSLVRIEPKPRLVDGVAVFDAVADDIACLKPVPEDFVKQVRQAKSLSTLECDWWAWSIADIKAVLENCIELKTIKICVDAPCVKLLGLSSNFALLPNLHALHFSINPIYAPGTPPTPLAPVCSSPLPTPAGTPVMHTNNILPHLQSQDQLQSQAAISTNEDPSMPLLREVKRFVRKCPKLQTLDWFGKYGRGSWTMARAPSTASKGSINATVVYQPPSIPENVWRAIEREAAKADARQNEYHISTREGQAWTGSTAAAFAAEQAAEIEKEHSISAAEKERHARSRESGRRKRALSISTSHSGDGIQLPTPTDSSHSLSPVCKYSPLDATHLEDLKSVALPPVTEGAELVWSNGIDHVSARKRTPPEPAANHAHPVMHRRTQSTSTATKDKGERQDSGRGSASAGARGSGKRRGAAATRGFRKRGSGAEGESASAQEGHPSRRGKGSSRGIGHASSSGSVGGSARKAATHL